MIAISGFSITVSVSSVTLVSASVTGVSVVSSVAVAQAARTALAAIAERAKRIIILHELEKGLAVLSARTSQIIDKRSNYA
ncbi:MAG: hypothetical protein AAF683_07330, partial [Pseudomonadota bacterium]